MTSEFDLQQSAQNTTTNTNQTQNNEPIEFDFNAPIEVEDASADFSVASKPPKAGIRPFKFKRNLEKKATVGGREFVGVIPGIDKNKQRFVGAHILLNLIDPDDEIYNNFQIGEYVNTIKPKNKPTSALHSLMNYLGKPIENSEPPLSLIQKVSDTLDEEPTGYAELEWKASYKSRDGQWKVIHDRMESFPKEKDENGKFTGEYSNETENPDTGEKVYAFAYIRRFVKNPNV
jgi:hypothetical protein